MGILQIANNNMVGAMRLVLTEKGLDPRDFTLLAFGGAGPVHVTDLMELGNLASAVYQIIQASSRHLVLRSRMLESI